MNALFYPRATTPTGRTSVRYPGIITAKPPEMLREIFLSLVDPEPMSGCWLWLGNARNPKYGCLQFNGKRTVAHRVSYELFVGPVPKSLTVDHKCRNTWCVNPNHLRAVTFKENVLCGFAPPAVNSRKMHCKNGHQFSEDNLARNQAGRRTCLACYRRFHRESQRRYRAKLLGELSKLEPGAAEGAELLK